jgi:hypothetical protein
MTSRKPLDWISKLAFSGGVTLATTYLAALVLTFRVF